MCAAVLTIALIVGNVFLFVSNRNASIEVSKRAQFIQQGAQLGALYTDIVKSLAELSARNQDTQLRDVLTRNDITITPNPAAAQSAGPAQKSAK